MRTHYAGLSIAVALLALPLFARAETGSGGTEVITLGDYESPMWQSNDFAGYFFRTFSQRPADCSQRLRFEVGDGATEVVGGIDTAVRRDLTATRIDDLNANFCTRFDYGVNLKKFPVTAYGEYFIGPKIMATPDTFFPPDEVGWYENYIIEDSNLTPDEWDTALTSRGTFLGTTTQDGSDYKHYTAPIATWTQFFAVRQCYRQRGTLSVAPIFQYWRTQGMPNHYLIEVRLNVETFGAMVGDVSVRNYEILPEFSSACF